MKIFTPLFVFVLGVITHARIPKVDLHDVTSARVPNVDSALLGCWGDPLDVAGFVQRDRLASIFCASHIISLLGWHSLTLP